MASSPVSSASISRRVWPRTISRTIKASGTANAPNEASRLKPRKKTCGTSLSSRARSLLTPRLVSRATTPMPSNSSPASSSAASRTRSSERRTRLGSVSTMRT
jgi:hypothetical protein